MYRNHEGYPDPTAGQAVANVMREYYREQRKKNRKKKIKRNDGYIADRKERKK
ncbi:MAG: hypothetical protein LUE20_04880 [Oscillospiraceae bacterium]|nr:hypothetical protein [Oscillospiraceae bacterium]